MRSRAAAALALLALLAAPANAREAPLPVWQASRPAPQAQPARPIQRGAPAEEVDPRPFHEAASSVARLRLERTPTRYQAWADNPLPGPVEVELAASRDRGVVASPALPVRKVVRGRSSALVSTLIVADPLAGGDFQLRLDAIPGDPQARPLAVAYRLPFDTAPVRVDQGPGGQFSHNDPQNQDAVDFALPEGTPVLAARGGVVMQVEGDFDKAGLDKEQYDGRSNFIRILHGDGTMAIYAHLKPEGVLVRTGQSIKAGERIGLSGNTGLSTAPHLHFAVQVNAGMRLVSVPFEMRGPLGTLRFSH